MARADARLPRRERGVGHASPLSRRLRDPRAIISIVLPIVLVVLLALHCRASTSTSCVDSIANANPWLLLAALAIYYVGFPLRGYRWRCCCVAPGTKVKLATRPRSSSSAGWSTASCRPSWVMSTAPTCCAQHRRVAQQDLRDDLHRARLRPLRDRGAGPRRRLLELPNGMSQGGPVVFGIGLASCRAGVGPVHGAQLRQPDHPPAAHPASHRRVLRPVRGGPLLGRRAEPAGAGHRHRHSSGPPRRSVCTWSSWPWVPISTWASAAPSSWPLSPRC